MSVPGGPGLLAGILQYIWPRRAGGAFTRALRFEKLKAPLFPGRRDTNDWCIRGCVVRLCFLCGRNVAGILFLTPGQVTLFVVTHPPDADRVEMFEYVKPGILKHIRTVADHKFR